MQAIRYQTRISHRGRLPPPPLRLRHGTRVEVIILVREDEPEGAELLAAAAGTLDFWNNPTDDRVWNDA